MADDVHPTRKDDKYFWLTPLSLLVAVLMVVLAARTAIHGEDLGARSVLNVAPVTAPADPGPALLVGAESEPGGTAFIAVDFTLEGAGDCRVYFDRRDNSNYHFMERKGQKVLLGLCESGVEQHFSAGMLDAAGGQALRLARHGPHIGLFQGSKLVASAFDDRLLGGTAGIRMLDGAPPFALKADARDDVHFADDFMISESKGSSWQGNGSPARGDFKVRFLKNPLLSANAFNYMGAGHDVYSVVGQPWWDHYRYDAALRGPAVGALGLVFAYHDDKNYGLFRWSSRKLDAMGAVTNWGKRELVLVRHGKEELLAQSDGGYMPDQWYGVSLWLTYAGVTVAIDGHTLLTASDPSLTSGGAGVWCDVPVPAIPATDPKEQIFQVNRLGELMKQHATFDDIRINTLEGFVDDFRSPGPAGTLGGGWLTGPGSWQVASGRTTPPAPPGASSGEVSVFPPAGSTKALIGDRRWAQYEVEADVIPGSSAAGIVFLHRDESNYFAALVDGGALKLTCVAAGKQQVVDSVPLPQAEREGPELRPVRLKATVKRGHVRVVADDRTAVEWFAGETQLRGRAGFMATAASQPVKTPSRFSRFSLSFLPEAEPLVTTNAIFEEELTMNDWTSPTSEWYPPREQQIVEGRPVNMLWHRSQFPGDVELAVEPRDFPEQKFELALSVAKDGQGKNNGYVFRYKVIDSPEGSHHAASVQIFRQGQLKIEKVLHEDVRQLSSLSLRRSGRYVVGLVNGRPVLHFSDESPLAGSKVAYYTQGVLVRTEATKITSNNFRNDFFSGVPASWRTAGAAIAEVANRWQCDPRWTFFSLSNDRRQGKAAVLWSKHLYPGDVTMEFYVANRMDGERGQPYQYARDINVTICSDGSDLNKGYTFMWGKDGNSYSAILRNGKEVARFNRGVPTTMDYHRHWFAVKIEKQGSRLSFRVDRFFGTPGDREKPPEIVFEDTQPLTGDHVALWTYDHSIMISRVRISGDGGNIEDHPDWHPAALRTTYDEK